LGCGAVLPGTCWQVVAGRVHCRVPIPDVVPPSEVVQVGVLADDRPVLSPPLEAGGMSGTAGTGTLGATACPGWTPGRLLAGWRH
jgi:hypothetical protein